MAEEKKWEPPKGMEEALRVMREYRKELEAMSPEERAEEEAWWEAWREFLHLKDFEDDVID